MLFVQLKVEEKVMAVFYTKKVPGLAFLFTLAFV